MSSYGFDYNGGNYVEGSGGFGGSSQSSPSGGRQRRDYGEQTLIPVTIRMILNAKKNAEDNMALPDGREIQQVKIVGAIRSSEDSTTKITYHVEDGTGLIDVSKWIDNNDSHAAVEFRERSMEEHKYVRVIGQVKEYGNQRSVFAFSIRPVSTANELTHHMLEVVHSAEKHKRGQSTASNVVPYMSNAASGVGFGSPTARPTLGGMNQAAAASGGGSVQQSVLEYIRMNGEQSDEGCSIRSCIASMNQFSEHDIRRAVAELAAEGEIYSTINEDTYKTAQ